MEARIAQSVQIEAAIERLLLAELDPDEGADAVDRLTSLGRLGAQLVLQRVPLRNARGGWNRRHRSGDRAGMMRL